MQRPTGQVQPKFQKAGVMNDYLRSAFFIVICVVDVVAIGLGITLYVTGA
jgi:hypothetical protein